MTQGQGSPADRKWMLQCARPFRRPPPPGESRESRPAASMGGREGGMAKGPPAASQSLLQRRRRRRRLLRRGGRRGEAYYARRAPRQGAAGGGGGQEGEEEEEQRRRRGAWEDFAASFVAAGLVVPPPPPHQGGGAGWPGPAAAVPARPGPAAAALVLCLQQTLTFTGKCALRCLYGSVQVLGFAITPDQPRYPLFSPHSHCALTVQATAYKEAEEPERERKTQARAVLRAHHVPREARCKLMKNFTPQCSIILLEQLDTPMTRFLLSHPGFSHLFRAKRPKDPCFRLEDEALASAGIEKLDLEDGLQVPENMLSAVKELLQACQEEDEGCPIILVCGPKSVGKSTFNRYLINLLLNRLPCIEYLECDLGQPEFTPPGCISLIHVTEPLLGPPYTHQRRPQKMAYFGETSCEHNTEKYIEVLKYVFRASERDVPLVVNTMGWVKGTGLLLLVDLIRLLLPSHIVQISAEDFKEMPQLSPEYIRGAAGLHTRGKEAVAAKRLKSRAEEVGQALSHCGFLLPPSGHRLLCVQPQFPGAGMAGSVRTHSSTLRELAILGYLGLLQPSDAKREVPLHGLVPYQVPFSAVALKVVHTDVTPAHILYALNASWVGLCQVPEELPAQADGPVLLSQTPICDCLGFGIVRGLDVEKKLYYILTPVAPEHLRQVNCLLVGSVSIPPCVFLNQVGVDGELPYVTSEYNFDICGAGKLKVKKYLKRREPSQP